MIKLNEVVKINYPESRYHNAQGRVVNTSNYPLITVRTDQFGHIDIIARKVKAI